MDAKTEAALRAQLEAERDRLLEVIAEMDRVERESLSDASTEKVYRDHMSDMGSATTERELDMTLEENARAALAEVGAALKRMDQGDYGVCMRCRSQIPSGRLEAYPTAALCIACKEEEESAR